MNIIERFIKHGVNRVFQGKHASGGEEGSSGVENLQGVLPYLAEPGDWYLGKVHDWDSAATALQPRWLAHKNQLHLWIKGSTRSRKGVGQIMYNVLTHPGSTIILDPKGESYLVAAQALKAKGKRVVLLDPMRHCARRLGVRETGDECGFNPLICINPWSPEAPRQLLELADNLIEKPNGNKNDDGAIWHKMARSVCAGLLAFALIHQTPSVARFVEQRSAEARIKAAEAGRSTLTGDDFGYSDAEQRGICALQNIVDFAGGFAWMSDSERRQVIALMIAFEGEQRKAHKPLPPVAKLIKTGAMDAMTLVGPGCDRESMTSLLMMFSSSFSWIDSKRFERELRGLDFKFRMSDVKTLDDVVVFVVLPDTCLQSHAPWMRMVVTAAINDIASTPWSKGVNPERYPINLIVDEAPQIGHIKALERSFAIGAGQDVRVIIISQNKTQMDEIYGTNVTEALISNSCQVLLAGGDNTTGDYYSRKAGQTFRRNAKTGQEGDDKTMVWGIDEVWSVVHPSQNCLTYWEGGRGPMRVRVIEYHDERQSGLKAGVDFTQHIEHQGLADQLLKRGAPASVAARPAGIGHSSTVKEVSHENVGRGHIMIGNGSVPTPPALTEGNA